MNFSLLAALKVVILTNFYAANDETVSKMPPPPNQNVYHSNHIRTHFREKTWGVIFQR